MSSMWSNNKFKFSIFGESHGKGIGVVIDNLPSGIEIDMDYILSFMARRAPGKDKTSTPRKEKDYPNIISGVFDGRTTGTPLCCVIENTNTQSSDYKEMTSLARPGHADFTGHLRYNGFNDVRGGGHFSGRLTAPLVFVGAICGLILKQNGITTGAHVASIKGVCDKPFDAVSVDANMLEKITSKDFPVIDNSVEPKMREEIEKARLDLDSVGGIIECCAVNVPAGIGNPMFDGIENTISSLVFGVPAIKGIEFGNGFEAANLFGSQNNDEFYSADNTVKTKTNNHGGILGGITSGMPIVFRVAVKPTPSIAKQQNTIDYKSNTDSVLTIKGRHDPCIAIRAVPVIESCLNIALVSHLI